MFGFDDLPAVLRRYLWLVIVTGPVLAALLAVAGGERPTGDDLGRAALLVVLAAVAERHTLHLTHKTSVAVGNAAYLAMICALPFGLAVPLAYLAAFVGQTSRRRDDWLETMFNAAQVAVGVAAGVLVFAMTEDLPLGPTIAPLGPLGAILAAGMAIYAANGLLVSVAAAFQLGSSPVRVWWVTLAEDFAAQTIVVAVGVVAALLTAVEPMLLPVLAVPLVLVHRAIAENIRLRPDTQGALAALVEVVELRDPYTAGHSQRVARLAHDLALRLGMTHEEADAIEGAGRVHDLGKVAIDPLVLTKAGSLSTDEWSEMRRHPGLGADVVARFAAFGDFHRLVRHHHEAWDGGGYPDRLVGEAIPLGARIMAVADAYDAMTSARPYRPAKSPAEALAIMTAGAGRQWDARVVAALCAELRETAGVAVPAAMAATVASAAGPTVEAGVGLPAPAAR
jgi:HD-GYP domain-containing protein (c-di-GMP phosphodiesterase class II)